VVHHGFSQEVFEAAIIGALGCSLVDLEQRFGLGPAHRLVFDRLRGKDAHAPGGIIGIERAGKMYPPPCGGPLARDHAITHNGKSKRGALAVGNF
jgi:hypothetical protein